MLKSPNLYAVPDELTAQTPWRWNHMRLTSFFNTQHFHNFIAVFRENKISRKIPQQTAKKRYKLGTVSSNPKSLDEAVLETQTDSNPSGIPKSGVFSIQHSEFSVSLARAP